jgi:hypothetical protein
MTFKSPVLKPKDYKYKIGDHVVINTKAKKDLPNDVGRVGCVSSYAATSPNYDYYIDLGFDIRKLRESEINLITSPDTYSVGEVIVNLINNEICTVDYFYKMNKEVRVLYSDSTADTTHISNIRKVIEDEEIKEDAKVDSQSEDTISRIIYLLLTGYKNDDGTYTLPSDLLHKLIEYGLKEVSE